MNKLRPCVAFSGDKGAQVSMMPVEEDEETKKKKKNRGKKP